jgi:integrase
MKHLSSEQIEALLDATTKDRDRLLLSMAYEHGLRVSEVIALRPESVKNGFLCTHPGKDGQSTVQRLCPSTLTLWQAITANLPPKARVFPISRQWASNIFHRACKAAWITLAPRQGIHTLRHSIAHHLLDAGAPLPIVQRKLGHQSLSSTGHYLKPDDSQVDDWSAKVLS